MILICSFLLLFIIFLLSFFIFLPIRRVGIVKYVLILEDTTPFGRITRWFRKRQMSKLSKEWYDKTRILKESQIPQIDWVEDKLIMPNGQNAFYCLDQYSDDCRELLCSEYNDLPREKGSWRKSFYTNKYMFTPSYSPSPKYNMVVSDNSLSIVTGDKLDTWIYLPSKKEESDIYALDFDFVPNAVMKETFQISFCMSSLARRLRFLIENDNILRFQVVDRGCFLGWKNKQLWNQFTKQTNICLHENIHVRLEVIKDVYALYFDGILQMAVRVDGGDKLGRNWALIFWNGIEKRDNLAVEIKNFKLFRPQETN
jgi:hypothetical protein